MLRRLQSHRILGSVRSSTTGNTFTSNSTLKMLDLEGLNDDKEVNIPRRPHITDTAKVHLEMLSPEEMCDLVVKLDFKDVFITSLARDSPLSGDPNYKPIPKKTNSTPATLKLLFTDIVSKYQDVFNSQIVKLNPQPERVEFPTINKKAVKILDEKVKEFKKTKGLSPVSYDLLIEFGDFVGVLSPKDVLRLDANDLSTGAVSLENFFVYLLRDLNALTETENEAVIKLMLEFTPSILVEGMRRILETLLKELRSNDIPEINAKYAKFINENILDRIPHFMGQLHISLQEDLVHIFIKSGDIWRARRALKRTIYKSKVMPKTKTIEDYLMTYEQYKHIQNSESESHLLFRERSIKYNLFLKLVFFSMELTPKVTSWILTTIDSVFELDHLVSLLLKQNNQQLLNQVGPSVLEKCIEIIETESNVLASVKVIQLYINLQKNGLQLDAEGKAPLVEFFHKRGLDNNAKYIEKL